MAKLYTLLYNRHNKWHLMKILIKIIFKCSVFRWSKHISYNSDVTGILNNDISSSSVYNNVRNLNSAFADYLENRNGVLVMIMH